MSWPPGERQNEVLGTPFLSGLNLVYGECRIGRDRLGLLSSSIEEIDEHKQQNLLAQAEDADPTRPFAKSLFIIGSFLDIAS
jgi:hypothetical protein